MRVAKATEKYEQCNVSEGDYVLWSRVDKRYHPKMLATWTASYRAKEVGEFSVVLEHLVTHELWEVHTSRVKLYAEDSFEVTDEILERTRDEASEREELARPKCVLRDMAWRGVVVTSSKSRHDTGGPQLRPPCADPW
ncbi:hypothetical protein DYB31_007403 [Aphanomyces astaci]|uniref:Uncharacterized protein n=1 Tax=Aphanomyces astaci TaxID=112090 RepID=A0A397EIX2_APHAT|nr:hypothetical protein DYB31_007403 [Aphanomyces astaci]